MGLCLLYLGR
uniref:Uncharacterized protein n=1 Tax=Anguilla anguilla TaxID=7936 RepID=A0A0E9PLW1_ANGAN